DADVPPSDLAGGAGEGGARRLQGCALCLGISRHGRGDDARARRWPRRVDDRHSNRQDGAAHQCRYRLCGLAIMARNGDDDFFLQAGAEILLETARFWASRAITEADGGRHIRHVIGPDEYHEDVDDSAFTNVMARWNLGRALEAVDILRARWPE